MQEQIDRVSRAIVRHRQKYGRRRLPERLREEALSLFERQLEVGVSRRAAAKVLAVPAKTLEGWRLKREKGDFVPVEVLVSEDAPIVLVSPCGWRLEGLSLPEVQQLLVDLR